MEKTKKFPEIRFKGFTEDWEQRKLLELGKIMTGSTPSTSKSEYYSDDGIPWVTPTDIESTTISDTSRKLSEEGAKVVRIVPANTILCTCIASIGKNTLLTVDGSFNQQINSLTPYDENDAYFLLSESELWSNKMKRMAASGAMQIINKTEFSKLETMVPKIRQQKQIGTFFRNLDNFITLHQCIYKYRNLQHKIQFLENKKAWEQCKFSDIGKYYAVKQLSINDLDESGKYEVIIYGELYTRYSEVINNVFSKTNKKITKSDKGDLIFPTSTTVDKISLISPSCIYKNNIYLGGDMFGIKTNNNIDGRFISYMINGNYDVKKKLASFAQGTTIIHISYDYIKNIEIKIPKLKEQESIANIFEAINNLITLHQCMCKKRESIWKKKIKIQNYL